MREIKFRAWMIEKNLMLHNVHLFYDTLGDEEHGNKWEPVSSFGQVVEKPDEYIVEQFTGVRDRNGKEIFEGDIISVEEDFMKTIKQIDGKSVWVVVFDEDWHAVVFQYPKKVELVGGEIGHAQNVLNPRWSEKIEVIGNVHENPELIA